MWWVGINKQLFQRPGAGTLGRIISFHELVIKEQTKHSEMIIQAELIHCLCLAIKSSFCLKKDPNIKNALKIVNRFFFSSFNAETNKLWLQYT